MLIEATSGNGSSSITMATFSVDFILDKMSKYLTRISTMVLGVMIVTVYFSFKYLFVWELVILGQGDEFFLQKEIKDFLSLCHIKRILYLCIRGLLLQV